MRPRKLLITAVLAAGVVGFVPVSPATAVTSQTTTIQATPAQVAQYLFVAGDMGV
jgi:hypothetical protein